MANLATGEDIEAPVPLSPGNTSSSFHGTSGIGSHWSNPNTPQHHHVGTSYFSGSVRAASSPSRPAFLRTMSSTSPHRRRSTSASSSHATHKAFNEEDAPDEADTALLEEEETDAPLSSRRRRGKGLSGSVGNGSPDSESSEDNEEEEENEQREDDPITLKDRQSLINVEHPFGLPIWKPALYKKSRSVTRYADAALHSVPSAQAERHLLPGNVFWTVVFGWWLSLIIFALSAVLYVIPFGGRRYSSLVFGLGWYVAWPFGKYVEGDVDLTPDEENGQPTEGRVPFDHTSNGGVSLSEHSTITPTSPSRHHAPSISYIPGDPNENTALLGVTDSSPSIMRAPSKVYGATTRYNVHSYKDSQSDSSSSDWLGKVCFWLALVCIIAPLMLIVCLACWALVVTIPMAKLNWALINYLFERPMSIRFCAAPAAVVVATPPGAVPEDLRGSILTQQPLFSVKHPRLSAGQTAPTSPTSTVLLCVYRAVGWQYYKYTVGGVNIIFINLLPLVFFVIFDGFVLLPWVEHHQNQGRHIPALLAVIGSRPAVFVLSLLSVIPLSYFIGMAVASISAQSSIGMGAVINATFGSIIEIILYGIALTQGKGHLVEGSIVGSLLAGVLLMPGMSMCSGALRKKELNFNAKSAGVTSMMLIMAFIGTLVPTLFYQIYGNFQLVCSGCPSSPGSGPWQCDHCYYQHPDPVDDPFYQSTVKKLMFLCAAVLLFSYLIGLWFSLRTHATQIWQNPQQLLHPQEPQSNLGRLSLHRHSPATPLTGNRDPTIQRKASTVRTEGSSGPSRSPTPVPGNPDGPSTSNTGKPGRSGAPGSPTMTRRVSYAPAPLSQQPTFAPIMESVDQAMKQTNLQPSQFPHNMSSDDFTRAVAVATVSALRHQQAYNPSPARVKAPGSSYAGDIDAMTHGGHEAPSWSRAVSASVLLACTALYAIIAELLVDVVDVILEGSGIDEKFLGITLFALVPNTTEFMNAMSFAMNGNIALSMEIGSAYALQVCLLQIPAMVAFSAWYAPEKMGKVAETFTLIFPRWDVVVIILSVFLMTYTYIEAKSNYHRGSILILSYLVLVAGFYFAPQVSSDIEEGHFMLYNSATLPFKEWTVTSFVGSLMGRGV